MTVFSQKDIETIQSRGINLEEIENQINNFIQGFPFVDLVSPALPSKGIVVLSNEEVQTYCSLYENQSSRYSVIKFVPASGAASRMFKDFFAFLDKFSGSDEEIKNLETDIDPNSIGFSLKNLKKYAFYKDLVDSFAKEGKDINKVLEQKDYKSIISHIVHHQGLNYGNLPKGLLKFHNYEEGSRTAFEEHMVEAAMYAKDNKGIARLHFTVSPEHINAFLQLLEECKSKYSQKYSVTYDISYSVQKPSTDTLAVDHNNEAFRDDKGELVFRPGGHGALVENLDELKQEIIFIKNIDNIVPDRLKSTTYDYKKAIGGLLISLKQQTDNYLDILSNTTTETDIDTLVSFCTKELLIQLPERFTNSSTAEKKEILIHLLNRPLRICGMVKNQGEPGGGPFWVRNNKGEISLQIVESSQVNLQDEAQKLIFSGSTHFNPVDLVCFVKDYKGNKFSLKNYIDRSTGFISVKSKDGRELKAQELPGLWNGAMADWISIFVEVPLITFNPVKTVNDLLRETHQ